MRALMIILILFFSVQLPQADQYTPLREKMVKQQLIDRGITDKKTIDALREVPRHLFVPQDLQERAYDDSPLPIGFGQTISQPYIVALMTQVAKPGPGQKALEIGTGSGYQAAVLSQIVDSVYTIEIVPELAKDAEGLFMRLGYGNIVAKFGDGYKGWPERAPFDIIIVTAAPEDIPQPLVDQLAENGRMIIPVGDPNSYQELVLAEKKQGKIIKTRITTVRFVPFRRL
ncbi:MAG TPA: protein-L-isoaspartate(D-aspartate) O-methyltransferase [Bacteroidales bacterium]|nr:protein-L-isoaspartate(D-aspartate) O-methyltransferase [Bacteroidales bacterium]